MVELQIEWASSGGEELAKFFTSNVDPSYISHGEILCGRALDPSTWSPDLHAVVCRELESIFSNEKSGSRVGTAYLSGSLAGLAIVAVTGQHAVLEDLVVAKSMRGQGVGKRFLAELEKLLRELGVTRVFLESGTHNKNAHSFFHSTGFEAISINMSKGI